MTAESWIGNGVAVTGGLAGLIGLYLSWSSGRAERTAKRLEQLISIESDVQARGAMPEGDIAILIRHRMVVKQIDEEIRLQEWLAFNASRRYGTAVSTAAVVGFLLYGGFLIYLGLHVASSETPVSDVVAAESWFFALLGVACVARAIVLAIRRAYAWWARREMGIRDTYSKETIRAVRTLLGRRRPNR